MAKIEGGCRCGAVRYTLSLDALPTTYACHCLHCQTWSGSAFSQNTFVPDDALVVSGPLAVFELTTPSGRTSTQRMCGTCHTRIFNTNSARPKVAVLRAGTLDRSDELETVAHIWVKRKHAWLTLPDGVPSWPEAADPPEALLRALKGSAR